METAFTASSLVILPSLPVPLIEPHPTLFQLKIFLAAGESRRRRNRKFFKGFCLSFPFRTSFTSGFFLPLGFFLSFWQPLRFGSTSILLNILTEPTANGSLLPLLFKSNYSSSSSAGNSKVALSEIHFC